jgi:hypothetical protein
LISPSPFKYFTDFLREFYRLPSRTFTDFLQRLSMASGSDSDGGHVGGGAPNLVPHENKYRTLVLASDEDHLIRSYNISYLVTLHFQELGELSIAGGDVAILERMFMAGFRFPFPAIAQELVVYLGVAPSQVKPNGWRYLFASFILMKARAPEEDVYC